MKIRSAHPAASVFQWAVRGLPPSATVRPLACEQEPETREGHTRGGSKFVRDEGAGPSEG